MVKTALFAGTLAAIAAFAPAAEADTKIRVFLGVPFHSYQVGPGWDYYDGYGWYDARRYGDFRIRYRDHRGDRLSCREARRLVQNSGYRNVQVRECEGRTYTFTGLRRGKRVLIHVNSRSGGVWRG